MVLKKIVSFLKTDIKDLKKTQEKESSQDEGTMTSKSKGKEAVGSNTIEIHNQALSEAKLLGSIMKNLDGAFFSSPDFLFYLDIKSFLINNENQYQGLNNPSELLCLAVKAQETFLKIEQTELRYRSRKQQDLYDFVFDLLSQKFAVEEKKEDDLEAGALNAQRKEERYYDPEEFKQLIRSKLVEVCQEIKTEQGKKPLEEYCDLLEDLVKEKTLGLKLLYLFKTSNNVDFSILRTLSDMVVYLQDKNVKQIKAMEDLVLKNQKVFLQVAEIINVPKSRRNPKTFAIILQYVTVNVKYQSLLEQFSQMISVLKDWRKCYRTVVDLRARYPENEYELPDDFKKEVIGLDIYQKYNQYIDLY
jgi:hypothetical protein